MNAPFRIIVKARSGQGIFRLLIGAISAIIAGYFAASALIYDVSFPWFIHALLLTVGLFGIWFLIRAVIDLRKNREWEFAVEADRLCWLSRDCSAEKVEGEIPLRSIRALVYRSDDSEVGAYLEVELVDDSVKRLPLVGVPSKKSLLAFINYWRDTHAEIPIRNLENA